MLIPPPKILPLLSNVGKYGTACQTTQEAIWRMHFTCWITKATEYVILFVL
jgi:hypothetical protein